MSLSYIPRCDADKRNGLYMHISKWLLWLLDTAGSFYCFIISVGGISGSWRNIHRHIHGLLELLIARKCVLKSCHKSLNVLYYSKVIIYELMPFNIVMLAFIIKTVFLVDIGVTLIVFANVWFYLNLCYLCNYRIHISHIIYVCK